MTRTHELIQELIYELEHSPHQLGLTDTVLLANAIHGRMCASDWPELNWMHITFEGVADALVVAERNVGTVETDRHGRPFTDDSTDALRELRESGGI